MLGLKIRDFTRASPSAAAGELTPAIPSLLRAHTTFTRYAHSISLIPQSPFDHPSVLITCYSMQDLQSRDISAWCVMIYVTCQTWYYSVSVTWRWHDPEHGTKHGQTYQLAKEGPDLVKVPLGQLTCISPSCFKWLEGGHACEPNML